MTVKQKQHLLACLGYYAGEVDGIWGRASREATEAFQKDHGLTADGCFGTETFRQVVEAIAAGEERAEEGSEKAGFWEDIEFFTEAEFRCKCGGRYCDGYPARMQEQVVRICDSARRHFGRPGHVISGLRCRTHNANEGGVADSQHIYGEAVDLMIEGVSADELLAYVQTLPHRYAYQINGTNVHVDIPKGER